MGETDKTLTLRPLGIGELFDRAVTLLVRNSVAFGAIAALYYFDIRIRREGYDLDASLDAMEGATA